MSNDGLFHLQVTYQYESGIDVYASERRVACIGGPTRTVVNDDDNIYQRDIVVSPEDFDSNDVYERIVMVTDGLDPNVEVHPEVLTVTARDGGTLTRDFSLALHHGVAGMIDDVDGPSMPTGDHDYFTAFLIDGTKFRVTIERLGHDA